MGAGDGAIHSRHVATVDGRRLPYLRGGPAGADALVYLHGLGGGGKWLSYHMALANDTVTYAPLLPGWQEGAAPDDLATVRDYARLVVRYMDAVGLERAILAGHSIGGWIALLVASEQPRRVSRLVLADPLGVAPESTALPDYDALDEEGFGRLVFARLSVSAPHAYGFGSVFTDLRKTPEFELQWKGFQLVRGLVRGGWTDAALVRALPGLEQETLLVWGQLDGLAPPAVGEALRGTLPNATLRQIDGAGHLPMTEKPETFHRVCHEFLARSPAAG
jgi:pyruvate dehydrogenase E2 component (dihydrolipoamide acetyltransferase)